MRKGVIYTSEIGLLDNPSLDQVFEACKQCHGFPKGQTVWFWVTFEEYEGALGTRVQASIRSLNHAGEEPGVLILEGRLPRWIGENSKFSAFYDAREGHRSGYIALLRSDEQAPSWLEELWINAVVVAEEPPTRWMRSMAEVEKEMGGFPVAGNPGLKIR